MQTFHATDGKNTYNSGLAGCLHWGTGVVNLRPTAVVKVLRHRVGDKTMRVFAEIDKDGIRMSDFMTNGPSRQISVNAFKRMS